MGSFKGSSQPRDRTRVSCIADWATMETQSDLGQHRTVGLLLLLRRSVMSDSVWPHRWQPPGSPVPGILQARTLEWVAISFSSAWKWKVKVKSLSRVWLLAIPWTAAYQTPPSMGFSRQECWSGLPLPSPFDFLVWRNNYILMKIRFDVCFVVVLGKLHFFFPHL